MITIFFVLVNWFMTFYNHNILQSGYSLGLSDLYNLKINFITGTLSGLLAGIIGGSALVFVNDRYFRKKSYGYALKATFVAYTIVFILVTISMSFLNSRLDLGSEANLVELFDHSSIYMLSKMTLIFYFFWGTLTVLVTLFLQISNKFGPGMLGRFLAGRYHQPHEEERIFMFMDMKSSTVIAEKIGNERYFNLLNDLFNDITEAVLSCDGEIYQYVGDEIVISWSLDKGVKRENCLRCFQKARQTLVDLAPYYQSKYDVTPSFKAGLHHGLVTAGEVGSIKKDIVYSGDVLNTASRIQEQCNHYQVDFLVSKETLDLLGDDISFEPIYLGNIELRGKRTKINLNTVKPK